MKKSILILVCLVDSYALLGQFKLNDSVYVLVGSIKKQHAHGDVELEQYLSDLSKIDSIASSKKITHIGAFQSINFTSYSAGAFIISINYPDCSEIFVCVPKSNLYKINMGMQLCKLVKDKNRKAFSAGASKFVFDSLGNLLEYYKFKTKDTSAHYNASFHDLTIEEGIGVDFILPDTWYANGKVKNCQITIGDFLYYYYYKENGALQMMKGYKKQLTAANDGYYQFVKLVKVDE